jgi:hypothetical protein
MTIAPHLFGAPDTALRKDIRLVTTILGETLVRAEGQQLLDLVEQVRAHPKGDRLEDLPEFDLETTIRLVRAFTAYFHLANVTEQVHRGRALLRRGEAEGGWIEQDLANRGLEGDSVFTDASRYLVEIAVIAYCRTALHSNVRGRLTDHVDIPDELVDVHERVKSYRNATLAHSQSELAVTYAVGVLDSDTLRVRDVAGPTVVVSLPDEAEADPLTRHPVRGSRGGKGRPHFAHGAALRDYSAPSMSQTSMRAPGAPPGFGCLLRARISSTWSSAG